MAKYKPKSKWQEQKIVGRSDKQEYDRLYKRKG